MQTLSLNMRLTDKPVIHELLSRLGIAVDSRVHEDGLPSPFSEVYRAFIQLCRRSCALPESVLDELECPSKVVLCCLGVRLG